MMKISVAIPVRNEANNIGELMRRLLEQTRSPDEIVITDGGSEDQTTQIIESFINNGAPVKLIKAGKALPGRGRNLAAAAANSDWVAFIDAGIEPDRNWLEALASMTEENSDVDVVYGALEPITESFFCECAAIAYVPPPALHDGEVLRSRSIASALMKRSVWSAVGGFPEGLRSAEDLLFMDRIEAAKFRTAYAPNAIVRWHLQNSFGRTFKRFLVYARHNMRAGLWRQWQEPIFTRYFLLAVIAAVISLIGASFFWVPLTLWALMLLTRALVAIRRNGKCYPASFARNLLRLMLLVPLIAVIDVAAIIGTIQWFLVDRMHGRPRAAMTRE